MSKFEVVSNTGDMIRLLEQLGYKVTPAHNEALSYHRTVNDDEALGIAEHTFKWEAVHMIARQLHPRLLYV